MRIASRTLVLFVLALILGAVTATHLVANLVASAPASVVSLVLPEYDFAILHPKSWDVKKEPQSNSAMNVTLSSPSEQFFMTITLSKGDVILKQSDLDSMANETLAALRSDGTQITVTKTEKGLVSNTSAKMLTATSKGTDGTLLSERQVYLVKGKVAHVFFLVSVPELYDQNLKIFNKTLQSISLGAASALSSSQQQQENIQGTAILKVTVKTNRGALVKNLEVDIGKQSGPPPVGGVSKTDAKGIATFSVKPGTYMVYFNKYGFPSNLQYPPDAPPTVKVTAGAPVETTVTLKSK
jgi:hypothetical protein